MIRMKIERAGEDDIFLSTRQHESGGEVYQAGLVSIDDITWRMRHKTGGLCGYEYGGIKIAPEVFGMPPPEMLDLVEISFSGSFLFTGPARLTGWDEKGASFSLVSEGAAYESLLDIGTDYNGNPVDFPAAFGNVEHVEPVRVADYSGSPCYHLGGCVGTIAKAVSGSADNGSGMTRITTSAVHGFSTSDVVIIEGDLTWSGAVTVIDTTNFDTSLAYSAAVAFGHAFKDEYFRAYDNGWPISGNVTFTGAGTFYLSANPVGQVTMCGHSVVDDTGQLAAYCGSRGPQVSPSGTADAQAVNAWITQQYAAPLEFLDEVFSKRGIYYYYQVPGSMAIHNTEGYWEDLAPTGDPVPLEDNLYGADGYDTPRWNVDNTVAGVGSTWTRRSASGSQVTESEKNIFVESDFKFGSQAEINLYDIMNDSDVNRAHVEIFRDYENKAWCSVEVPFSGVAYGLMGLYLSVEDRATGTSIAFVVRAFQINFRSLKMTLSGEVVRSEADPVLVMHLIFENDPAYWNGTYFIDQSGNANHGYPQVAGPVWGTKTAGQDCITFDRTWWLKVLHDASLNLTDEVRISVDANLMFFMTKYPTAYNGGYGYGFQSAIGWISTVDFMGSHYLPHTETASTWTVWEALFKGSTSYELKKDTVQQYLNTTSINPLAGSTADLMIGQRADLAYNNGSIIDHKVREIKIYNSIA